LGQNEAFLPALTSVFRLIFPEANGWFLLAKIHDSGRVPWNRALGLALIVDEVLYRSMNLTLTQRQSNGGKFEPTSQ
jgi:hypothetical protein